MPGRLRRARASAGHFMDSFRGRGFTGDQRGHFILDGEMWRQPADGVDRPAAVRFGDHGDRVEIVRDGPAPPRRLDAGRGIDLHAVEIEEERLAA